MQSQHRSVELWEHLLTANECKQDHKYMITKIKTKDLLIHIWNEIDETEPMFFDQQNDHTRTYLQSPHFSEEDIKQFLATALWMQVIFDT